MTSYAQTQNTPDPRTMTLRQRFDWMMTNSETYGEYKVVKEYLLNVAWKVVNDSVQKTRRDERFTRDSLKNVRHELASMQQALTDKEKSLQPLEYAGSHITVFGIPFAKKGFLGLVCGVLGLMVTGLAFLLTRLKQLNLAMSEKSEMLSIISSEYEDYKRRSLEKQMKLSRELQSERNRLMELQRV
ncbi:MAG: hypothetical protein JST14_15885 [Bacteroidetes bacterium]|nr:hypothetical protein [Bacteroidota bacterium]